MVMTWRYHFRRCLAMHCRMDIFRNVRSWVDGCPLGARSQQGGISLKTPEYGYPYIIIMIIIFSWYHGYPLIRSRIGKFSKIYGSMIQKKSKTFPKIGLKVALGATGPCIQFSRKQKQHPLATETRRDLRLSFLTCWLRYAMGLGTLWNLVIFHLSNVFPCFPGLDVAGRVRLHVAAAGHMQSFSLQQRQREQMRWCKKQTVSCSIYIDNEWQ